MTSEVLVRLGVDVAAEAVATREFEVVVIRAGEANGYHYSPEVLAAGTHLFRGATVFVNHPDALDMTRPGGRRVEDVAGVVSDAWFSGHPSTGSGCEAQDGRVPGGGQIRAYLTTGGPRGPWVGEMAARMVADREAGLPVPNVGLSADMYISLGADGRTVTAIKRVVSLDVVFDPAAGGAFERVLNSVQLSNAEIGGVTVGEEVGAGGDVGGDVVLVGGDQAGEAGGPASGASPGNGGGSGPGVPSAGSGGAGDIRESLASLEKARLDIEQVGQEQLRLSCASLLGTALQSSTLPDPLKEEVRTEFEGRVFNAEELRGAMDRKADVYAKLVESSVIRNMGYQGPVVHGMRDSLDRVQAATNRLLGVPVGEGMEDTPRLSGLRELYIMLTGDYDFHGVFHPERVQLANVTTATMTSVVKNAMNVSLLEAFNMRPKWWAPIAYEEDFATMDDITWVTLGGFGDLPTVAEGGTYTELEWADDENTSSFVKKGGYVGITLEMIDRDRVSAVRAIPRKLGLAAWRTVSSLVSALFTDNAGIGPTLDDTGALFNATAQSSAGGHKNLLTTALSLDAWDAVVQAMYQLTEQNSNKPQGIRPSYCLVPIELEKTALTIFGSPQIPGSADNDINVRMMSADHVITVPEWTDGNNWAAAADPAHCQGVCIGYRFGREPELFVADSPLTGSMFTNDEMRIKGRFVVAVGIGNYRALHKNNVS